MKRKKIKVLHAIGELSIGGSQMLVLNIMKNIDKDIQFDFIVDHSELRTLEKVFKELGANIYYIPTFYGWNLKEVVGAWRAFFEEHTEYDILHSHVRSYASIYFPIAKKYGVKTIIHSHSISNGKGFKAFVKNVFQIPLRYEADYFFACSNEAGKWLFGKRVIKKDVFFVIHNAIDSKEYQFDIKIRNEVRADIGITKENVYISVGRLVEAKNHEYLLNVFEEIKLRNANSILLIIGDGPCYEEIKKLIEMKKLEKSVLLLGARKDVAKLLQAGDCFLFPSLWEGLGLAAIEAQASGLKCICSENVPKEARITELCKFISLDNKKKWVSEALSLEYERKNTVNNIIGAGYDIKSIVKWLEDFYVQIVSR